MGFELFYDVAYIIGESFVSPSLAYHLENRNGAHTVDWPTCYGCALCYWNLLAYCTYGSVSPVSFSEGLGL
jgi:NAD-dependent dihydropyrimidine dehydrogenase PreA subunit